MAKIDNDVGAHHVLKISMRTMHSERAGGAYEYWQDRKVRTAQETAPAPLSIPMARLCRSPIPAAAKRTV